MSREMHRLMYLQSICRLLSQRKKVRKVELSHKRSKLFPCRAVDVPSCHVRRCTVLQGAPVSGTGPRWDINYLLLVLLLHFGNMYILSTMHSIRSPTPFAAATSSSVRAERPVRVCSQHVEHREGQR